MKIEGRYKPEMCVSKDEARPQLTEPYLDAERRVVVASNGYMLVAVPVTVEQGDVAGHVGAPQLSLARSGESGAKGLRFPDWTKALPPFTEGEEETVTVALSAKYLAAIAKALGADKGQVVLTMRVRGVEAAEEPILVRAANDQRDGALAALMPVRFSLRRPPPPSRPASEP